MIGGMRQAIPVGWTAPLRLRLRFGLTLLLPWVAMASSTAAWEMGSWSDFIRGRFQGISLSREGRLSLAPKVETVFSSDQPVIWAVAEAPDGTLYAATGNRGRVYRIGRGGASSLLWTADQPEVFAIAMDMTARSTPAPRRTARFTASRTAKPRNTSRRMRAISGR